MAIKESPIRHVVVVMLENRSFDNMLGRLYDKDNVPRGQAFEGVFNATGAWWDGAMFPPSNYPGNTSVPSFDPHEPYMHMYLQMIDPRSQSGIVDGIVPNPVKQAFTMTGFIEDYSTVKEVKGDRDFILEIMNCFRPADVPVINQIAASAAVCDHWHASVPSQTFTNRSFVHAGTASGYVNNSTWKDGVDHVFMNDTETIFHRLESAGRKHRIYFGARKHLCNAYVCQKRLRQVGNFFDMGTFFSDVASVGTTTDEKDFPAYTFIEPILIPGKWGVQNDMHPVKYSMDHISTVDAGDYLLWRIHDALSNNHELWDSTMLIVLFDENGGTYDHVAPVAGGAISPDAVVLPKGHAGYSAFEFDRLGMRVPAIVCSPHIEAGTVCNTLFDHTSVIRTVADLFLGGSPGDEKLGARAAKANSLLPLIGSTRRTDTPAIKRPKELPRFDFGAFAAANADFALSDLQRALVLGAIQIAAENNSVAFQAVRGRRLQTLGDAWAISDILDGI